MRQRSFCEKFGRIFVLLQHRDPSHIIHQKKQNNMAKILFTAIARKSPVDKSVSYYPIQVPAPRVMTDDLVNYIAENSQLPRAVVPAALAAIQKSIVNFVLNGHSVTIPRLGTFTATVKSTGRANAADVHASDIKKVLCRFRPSAETADPVKYGMSFERVAGIYDAATGE